MRDNLVFKNVEETQGETEADIEGKLGALFKEKLKINEGEIKEITIERAHRVGRPWPGQKRPRNIVAKMSSKGKAKVMAHLKNLPRSETVRITEQYPP